MLFDSPVFFVFLTIVVSCYWWLPHRRQNQMLLLASYVFYGWWDWRFLGLIFISTFVDFFCALAIDRSSDARTRKSLLALSLVVNLTFLGFFKYFNFFVESLTPVLTSLGVPIPESALRILLPPGISFYTFQAVAYIVDVYFKRLPPAKSLLDYALFITLFPHLIAGPIQRPSHLLPQVQNTRSFSANKFFDGLMLIITGLFRKCVVADSCALIANAAFDGRLGSPSLAVLAIGAYAFAWQIYGDFSGYSDIARGSAQLLGFHFMVNFEQPYLARSLQDFWRRWHISLSTWLRDYLYIPLGGSRGSEIRTNRNLIITMLLGGLWHGANWTYVVWGGIHGFGLAAERFGRSLFAHGAHASTKTDASFFARWSQRIVVFHLVCIAWIFFRAADVSAAFAMLSNVGQLKWRAEYGTVAMFLAFFALPLFFLDLLMSRRKEEYPMATSSFGIRCVVAGAMLMMTLLFSASSASAFIYFQF